LIDLSGANVSRNQRPPQVEQTGEASIQARSFEISAIPLLLEGIPATVSVRASETAFSVSQAGEHAVLVPQRATDGKVSITIARGALESLVQKAASEAAGKQGVEIKETHLEFTSRGEKAMSFRADVVGKIFVMKAPVSLTGELSIDDDLNLHLSNLAIGGSGMLANLANNFAQPHLKKAAAEPIALGMFSFGALKLRDIRLGGGETLSLEAAFGS
jgi:hypothetical protein